MLMTVTKRTILLMNVVLALGCSRAKSSWESESPEMTAASAPDSGSYDDYDSGGMADSIGSESIDEEVMDEPAPEPAEADAKPMAKSSRRGLFGRRDRSRRAARREISSPGPQGGAAADGAPSGAKEPAVAPAEDPKDEQVPDHGRHIIYTAMMQVSVFNMEEAMKQAEALPERFGGYIQNMQEGQLIMRIPAPNLRKALNEIGEYGIVESRHLQASDVTAEFVDIESRIRVLRETQKQLIALLAKARNVEEALRVRQTLDKITMELEVLEGRKRQLANLIGFSTVTLTLIERGPHHPVPSSNDPFPWVDALGVEATQWK